jgi:diguanylate cyclase (GGDEF)-like protein
MKSLNMTFRFHLPERLINWRPGRIAHRALTVLVLVLVPFIGMIHLVTGPTVEMSVFYLIPVVFAAWHLGTREGIAVALVAVVDWFLVETAFDQRPVQLWDDIFNAAARFVVFLVVVTFTHFLRKALDRAHDLARVDPLTQLLNVKSLQELGSLEVKKAVRENYAMTAMFIDLDGFKAINDSLGHQAGDAVLRVFADALRANVRETDLTARVGGDEFLIVMPNTGPEAAANIAAKLRAQLLDSLRSGGWSVTFSLGASTFVTPAATIDELVNHADAMMYRAKERGKNAIEHEVVGQASTA